VGELVNQALSQAVGELVQPHHVAFLAAAMAHLGVLGQHLLLGGHLPHAAVLCDVPAHPALVAHARLRAVLRLRVFGGQKKGGLWGKCWRIGDDSVRRKGRGDRFHAGKREWEG
jgi:hypothetical protein